MTAKTKIAKTKQGPASARALNTAAPEVLTASQATRDASATCTCGNCDDDDIPECLGHQSLQLSMEECVNCDFFDDCNRLTVARTLDCILGCLIDLMNEHGLIDSDGSRK